MSSAGPGEDGVEHRLGQLAGEGVLLARVVRAEHGPPARERASARWPKRGPRPQAVVGGHGLPGDLPEGDHDHGVVQQRQLAGEIRRARVALVRASACWPAARSAPSR